MSTIKSEVKMFLSKSFDTTNIRDEDDIFSLGFVNSLFAMQLVLFVEAAFGISIGNEDLELDNFRSLNAIESLVQRKRGSSVQKS